MGEDADDILRDIRGQVRRDDRQAAMTEPDKSGQRLLLAAIKLGTAKNARFEATDAYMVALDEYDDAFKEYVQIMEGQ